MSIRHLDTVCMSLSHHAHSPLHLTFKARQEGQFMYIQPKLEHCSTLFSSPVHLKISTQSGPLPRSKDPVPLV